MPLRTAKLKEKKQFTDDVIELTFETPEAFAFRAGQFTTFKVADKMPPCFRAYSISSSPSENGNTFSTCLKLVENGRGSNWLNTLKVGDDIEFLGPNGNFLYKGNKDNAIFIATGTGITPFKAIIKDELKRGNKKNLQLLFGLRHASHVFYQDFFENLVKEYPNFSYHITLTKPENHDWQGKTGRVTEFLRNTDIDVQNTEVYICGLKIMIEEVVAILKEKGMAQEDIHFEKYD